MRRILFAAAMVLSFVAVDPPQAEAKECYIVADFRMMGRFWGHQECFKDNWLFGGILDFTAYYRH